MCHVQRCLMRLTSLTREYLTIHILKNRLTIIKNSYKLLFCQLTKLTNTIIHLQQLCKHTTAWLAKLMFLI